MENESEKLNERIEELESEKVEIYDYNTNQFKENVQKCVHRLLEHNVSSTENPNVIQACLDLARKEADHALPSVSTIRKMNLQRGVISSMQIAEDLPKQKDLTLATYEAYHYGKKYATFTTTDADSKLYALGLRDLLTKSGKDILDAFKQILFDIDKIYYNPEIGDVSQDIPLILAM